MIDIEQFKDIGAEWMEWTFTKRPTKLWVNTEYGRAVIDTKEHAGTTASWYLEDEVKLMAEAPRLLVEVKRLREGIEQALEAMSCHTNHSVYNSSWNILKELIE
mgnify:FL=1